jgi:SAM-dependent methyltransferase
MKFLSKRLRWIPAALLAGLAVGYVARRTNVVQRARHTWPIQVYRLIYLARLTPWDTGMPATTLVAKVEGDAPLSRGRALDIGCGGGRNSVYLARRGWQVTGVDVVPRALGRARRRAAAADVSPTFLQGDVTRLRETGIGGHFDLLLDFGCLHTIPPPRRDAYVDGVTAAAAPGATLLMVEFLRPRLAPMEAGLTPDEVRERFRAWDVVSARALDGDEAGDQFGGGRLAASRFAARGFQPWAYELRRRA